MPIQAEIDDHQKNSRRNRVGLTTNDETVRSLAHDWVHGLEATKKRKFSAKQLEDCFNTTLCLCLDLLAASISQPPIWIGYSRGKKNFISGGAYWDQINNKAALSRNYLLDCIDYLEVQGLLDNHTAHAGHAHFSSRMKASDLLVEEFTNRGLNWTCVEEKTNTDIIIVKDYSKKPMEWPPCDGFPLEQAIDNLFRINEHLQQTLVNLKISDKELYKLNASVGQELDVYDAEQFARSKIDFTQRKLRRVFGKGSFHAGGRFYGGWWQGVPSRYRKFIEINGWATVELDYSTIQPRILYAAIGALPPDDSYSLPGWNAELRPIIKKTFSQLLNSDKSSRDPNQWHRFAPNLDPEPIPDDWHKRTKFQKATLRRQAFAELTGRDYSELISDLLESHEAIKHTFFSGVWGETQAKDAKIVEKVLVNLIDRDNPEIVLPIHDSFIVRFGREQLLRDAMEKAFHEVVGVEAVIDQDKSILDPPEYDEGNELDFAFNQLDIPQQEKLTYSEYLARNEQWEARYGKLNNMDIMVDSVEDLKGIL